MLCTELISLLNTICTKVRIDYIIRVVELISEEVVCVNH